jgi:hypothetical protein
MVDQERTRGPVSEVVAREHTQPLPDALLTVIEESGLRVRDLDNRLIAYRGNRRVGAAWMQDDGRVWFAVRTSEGPAEYADRDAAVRFMVGADAEAVKP